MKIYTSDSIATLVSLELSFHQWAMVSSGTVEEEFITDRFDLHYTLVDVERSSKDGLDLPLRLLDMQYKKSLKDFMFSWTTEDIKERGGAGREVIDQGGSRREGFIFSVKNLIENSHVFTCMGEYNFLALTLPKNPNDPRLPHQAFKPQEAAGYFVGLIAIISGHAFLNLLKR